MAIDISKVSLYLTLREKTKMSRNFISDITNTNQPVTNLLVLRLYVLIIYKQEVSIATDFIC